uniref:DUF4200 domain-containing protein n=1 Tax=Seriola dumerili TaxID=41447 RepID=A0A3B4UP75_SERDU
MRISPDLKMSANEQDKIEHPPKRHLLFLAKEKAVHDIHVEMTNSKIMKLDRAMAAERQQIKCLEKKIATTEHVTEEYLQRTEKKAADAEAFYEKQQALKQEKNAVIKKLQDEIETMKNKYAKDKETLKKYKRYKSVMCKVMTSEWVNAQAEKMKKLGTSSKTTSDSSESEKQEKQHTEAENVFDIVAHLSEQNMSLIDRANKGSVAFTHVQRDYDSSLKKMKEIGEKQTLQINECSDELEKLKKRAFYLNRMILIHESLKTANEDAMLHVLGLKVIKVYCRVVNGRPNCLTTLEMLCSIEHQVSLLLDLIEQLPEEIWEKVKKIKLNRKRQMIHEKKLRLEMERENEKRRKCNQRIVGKKKKTGTKKLRPKCVCTRTTHRNRST